MDIDLEVLAAFSITPPAIEAPALDTPPGYDKNRSKAVMLQRSSMQGPVAGPVPVFYKRHRKIHHGQDQVEPTGITA